MVRFYGMFPVFPSHSRHTDVNSTIDVAQLSRSRYRNVESFLFSTAESFYETFLWYESDPLFEPPIVTSWIPADLITQTDTHKSLAGWERRGIMPI